MDWTTVASLIIQYGLPLAEKIVSKWTTGSPPTPADFVELNAAAAQNAAGILKGQLAAAGIPLTDPHAVALLALVS